MKLSIKQALEARGYTSLTPVQEAVSDPELAGLDLLVSAQTGSGKTVGFGLAIAPTVLGTNDQFKAAGAPLALVIAPTRELALQVKRELAWLYGQSGVVMASCVGGMDMRDERRSLARGAHIVVATPGRLRDHITRGHIDLSALRAVVLDEADEMLDLGFREDLEFILGEAPEERQTLLFSATVSKPIAKLAESYQRDAQRISTLNAKEQHSDISYLALKVAPQDVENAIINVLRYHESPNAIVFANTRAAVSRMVTRLSNRGFSAVSLSGELTQSERANALQAMRDGRARICVATDVAARGIDLPNLDLVIHADLPKASETLLHRSGRTGRAGRKGVSALIVGPKSMRKADRLLRDAKLEAEWQAAPSADEVRARDLERMLADPSWEETTPDSLAEARAALIEKFDQETLAAGYLRLWSQVRTAPEELSNPDDRQKREPRAPFGPSVWFAVKGGRAANAEPRRILPMLCDLNGLSKENIGAIRIQEDESFVEIQEGAADALAQAIEVSGALADGSRVTRLKNAPKLEPRPKRSFGKGGPGGRDGDRGGFKKRDDRPRDDRPRDDRPRDDKPRGERPSYKDRDNRSSDAPRAARATEAKPRKSYDGDQRGDWGDKKPRHNGKSDGDAPRAKPRHKDGDRFDRPKSGGKFGDRDGGRPAGRPSGKPGGKPGGKFGDRGGDKPRGKPAGKFSDGPKSRGFGGKGSDAKPSRKGPLPPEGKPNSKKNKARRAADPSQRMAPPRAKR